jgi:hypothetical protein
MSTFENEKLEELTPTEGDGIVDTRSHAQQERETRSEWEITHRQMYPAPTKQDTNNLEVNWWSSYGWAFLIVIGCLGLFIAARTGKGIYDANIEEGFGGWSFWLTLAAVAGIEGLIVVFGFFRPRKIENNWFETLLEKSYSWISVAIGLFISASSGMKFFISTFESLQDTWGVPIDKSLSLALGVGLTFVLFGVSEFAGRLKWIADNTPYIREWEFKQEQADYIEQMNVAWFDSNEYILINRQKLLERKIAEADQKNVHVGRKKIRDAQQQAEMDRIALQVEAERLALTTLPTQVIERQVFVETGTQQQSQGNGPKPSVAKLVDQYVYANGLSYEDALSAAEIAAKLHVDAGTVRSAISRKRKALGIPVGSNGQSA